MTTPILVTGGTGTLGRHIVQQLREAGHPVRVLSRTKRQASDGVEYLTGDLATGHGVEAAVTGVETIIHCAGGPKGDDVKAGQLVAGITKADTKPHVIYISVVGADRTPVVTGIDRAMFGYIAAKRAAEVILAESGLPWTTLRATQFHDLTFTTMQAMAKLPIVPVLSGIRFQPIETGEVAARLVELALSPAQGLVPDLAGPRVYPMKELVRSYLRATGKHRVTIPMRPRAGLAGPSAMAPTSPPGAPSENGPGRTSSPRTRRDSRSRCRRGR